jgi:two-component system cell cycle sensor histidine kinase/response regulator CckA
MGGKEAIENLREIDPHVKAIVSTGYADDPVTVQFKEYGFCGVVMKPYTVKELSETLHTVLQE